MLLGALEGIIRFLQSISPTITTLRLRYELHQYRRLNKKVEKLLQKVEEL